MTKRLSWTTEVNHALFQEDQLVLSLISSLGVDSKKIKWAQISTELKVRNPEWSRTGKQCRERYLFISCRWLNHLKPRQSQGDELDHVDLQQLFHLIRVNGKKWSLIAKELPGTTDNAIKNFFYASLRKGLRNLNVYNTEIRSPRRYKIFKQDLIDKVLSVHD